MKIQKLFLAVLSSSVLCTSCMDNFLDTESPSIPVIIIVIKIASTFITKCRIIVFRRKRTRANLHVRSSLPVDTQFLTIYIGVRHCRIYTHQGCFRQSCRFKQILITWNTRWDKLYYLAESATTIVDGIRRSPLMQSTSDKAFRRMLFIWHISPITDQFKIA